MTPFELGIVLLSALLHAAWNAYAKDNPHPTTFLAWMGIATILSGIPLLFLVDFSLVPMAVWWILPGTTVVHLLYQIFLGRSYETGDLTVVYPISRSTPAFVALVAVPLLDDPVSVIGGIGIAVVMLGMWLVHTQGRVSMKAFVQPGIGFAYLTLATTVGYSLLDKMAMAGFDGPDQYVPRAIIYFYLLTTAHTLLFVPYVFVRVPRETWGLVLRERWGRLLIGLVASVASYVLILEALRTASVSYVTAVRQTSVVFAAILATIMLKETPGKARILGSVLTVVGVTLIALFP